MRGLVFELKNFGVYVMDSEGFFAFVPGFLDRRVGDEIEFSLKPERCPPALLRWIVAALLFFALVLIWAAGLVWSRLAERSYY